METHVMVGFDYREQSGRTVWSVTDEERLVWARGFAPRGASGRVYTVAVAGRCIRVRHADMHEHTLHTYTRRPRREPGPQKVFTFTFTLLSPELNCTLVRRRSGSGIGSGVAVAAAGGSGSGTSGGARAVCSASNPRSI